MGLDCIEVSDSAGGEKFGQSVAAAGAAATGITNLFVVVEKVPLFRIVPNSDGFRRRRRLPTTFPAI